jgi:CRP-like cAMP-binding protein
MRASTASPRQNQFLDTLGAADRARLEPLLRAAQYGPGGALQPAAANLFFPTTGLVAELVVYPDGRSALARMVGVDGVVGAIGGLSANPQSIRAVALTHTEGFIVDAAQLRALIGQAEGVRASLEAEVARAFGEAAAIAGCAACHRLDERLSSMLLHWRRKAPGRRVVVTHDQLCQMLGAQRTTVTAMMRGLKLGGVIRTGRGWLEVLDAPELARRSCGCGGKAER